MKKRLVLFLVVGCLVLTGCKDSQPAATETTVPVETTVPAETAVCGFLDIEWTRAAADCTETLCFRSNGDCSYSCACGNPVNDNDLCQGYRYEEAAQRIYLDFSEISRDTVTQIAVKSCDGNTLVLDFNGEIRTFQRADKAEEQLDQLTYLGEQYIYMPFPGDIFYYDLHNTVACEEDENVPIPHSNWKFVYRDGDLFVLDAHKTAAVDYFHNDENYDWFIVIEDPDSEEAETVPISVTAQDRAYIYSMEGMKRDVTLLFEDIEIFASLVKTDKTGLISASASLAYYAGNWYWRSEAIDDSAEGWPEYVIQLPESIVKQITVRE